MKIPAAFDGKNGGPRKAPPYPLVLLFNPHLFRPTRGMNGLKGLESGVKQPMIDSMQIIFCQFTVRVDGIRLCSGCV